MTNKEFGDCLGGNYKERYLNIRSNRKEHFSKLRSKFEEEKGYNDRLDFREDEDYRTEKSKIRSEFRGKLVSLFSEYLEQECSNLTTKKDKIIALKAKFSNFEDKAISESIDCSVRYAKNFFKQKGTPPDCLGKAVVWKGENSHIIDRNKKYRNKGQEKEEIPDKIKKEVLNRDGHECVFCGREKNLAVHHIIPVSQRGSHKKSNLATLCKDCHYNAHKGDFTRSWPFNERLLYKNKDEFWKFVENPEKWRTKVEKWRIEVETKSIDGIGESTSEKLFEKFGSLKELKQAKMEQLLKVPYITEVKARRIKSSSRSSQSGNKRFD